jgi:hypothetical protein
VPSARGVFDGFEINLVELKEGEQCSRLSWDLAVVGKVIILLIKTEMVSSMK